MATAADFALEIQRTAVENDVEPGPSCSGGWKAWVSAVRSASQGQMPSGVSGKLQHKPHPLALTGSCHTCLHNTTLPFIAFL